MFRLLSTSVFVCCLAFRAYSQSANIPYDDAQISEKLADLWSQGYLFSSLDSINTSGDGFYQGDKYEGRIGALYVPNVQIGEIEPLSVSSRNSIDVGLSKQLDDFANHGFPFVRIIWDSITIHQDTFLGYLTLIPGPEIRYDSLQILGDPSISSSFLAQVIDAKYGALYSESDFAKITDRLDALDFLELTGEPDVAFEAGKAFLYLPLQDQSQGSFEGVVGILPRQSPNDRLAITGFVDLDLNNLFRSGKSLHFVWNRFSSESQSVDLDFKYPFFLGSRLFLSGSLGLLKQDTTFLNQSWEWATGLQVWSFSELSFGYTTTRGSLINPSLTNISENQTDYRSKQYFIGARDLRFGQPFVWKDDFRFHTNLAFGNKVITRNPAIASEAYDSLNLETMTVEINAAIEYQLVFGKGGAFYHELEVQSFSNGQVLQNELSRLGGLRSVRGFNENFFYAQHYILNRLEWRQYFEKRSFLSLFTDQLFIDQQSDWEYAHGYGLGLSLETSNGLFTFASAIGKSKGTAFDPANVKIHFGYTSTF